MKWNPWKRKQQAPVLEATPIDDNPHEVVADMVLILARGQAEGLASGEKFSIRLDDSEVPEEVLHETVVGLIKNRDIWYNLVCGDTKDWTFPFTKL